VSFACCLLAFHRIFHLPAGLPATAEIRMRNVLTSLIGLVFASAAQAGPFAPAAGQAGSTAIHKDDASIVQWATGWQDYRPNESAGAVANTWRTPEKALGKAAGDSYDIVSLGNGGTITLTFGGYIFDGEGPDFAVFENSFNDTFLELAFVEVSSNGTDFFRFPVYSFTPSPVNAFGSVDPTNIDGFAGKYRQGWGTPFDLAQLAGTDGLDTNRITHVRLVDVVGNGTEFDNFPLAYGGPNRIYDPYNTTGSQGFDLDAIGVMHFAAAVPEPSQIALFAAGLGLIALRRRRA
jgi:hypothetical protein